MDNQLQRYLRAYRAGELDVHPQVLSRALRIGHLDKDRIALCAFLGHPAANQVLSDVVRNDRFIWFDKPIPNGELRDLINSLPVWGPKTVMMASLGTIECVAKLLKLNKHNFPFGIFENPQELIGLMAKYIEGKPIKVLRLKIRKVQRVGGRLWARTGNLSKAQFQIYGLERIIEALQFEITQQKYGTYALRKANGIFSDNTIYEGIRNRIYPWALGEWV